MNVRSGTLALRRTASAIFPKRFDAPACGPGRFDVRTTPRPHARAGILPISPHALAQHFYKPPRPRFPCACSRTSTRDSRTGSLRCAVRFLRPARPWFSAPAHGRRSRFAHRGSPRCAVRFLRPAAPSSLPIFPALPCSSSTPAGSASATSPAHAIRSQRSGCCGASTSRPPSGSKWSARYQMTFRLDTANLAPIAHRLLYAERTDNGAERACPESARITAALSAQNWRLCTSGDAGCTCSPRSIFTWRTRSCAARCGHWNSGHGRHERPFRNASSVGGRSRDIFLKRWPIASACGPSRFGGPLRTRREGHHATAAAPRPPRSLPPAAARNRTECRAWCRARRRAALIVPDRRHLRLAGLRIAHGRSTSTPTDAPASPCADLAGTPVPDDASRESIRKLGFLRPGVWLRGY